MKPKFLCLCFFLLASHNAFAADRDFTICAVAGFYEVNHNRFLTDLAERVAAKNNLFGDDKCTQAIKAGKEAGDRYQKPGVQRSEIDMQIIRSAIQFSNQIYDSILSRVKF